jgi:hypothetical protein
MHLCNRKLMWYNTAAVEWRKDYARACSVVVGNNQLVSGAAPAVGRGQPGSGIRRKAWRRRRWPGGRVIEVHGRSGVFDCRQQWDLSIVHHSLRQGTVAGTIRSR